MENKIADVLKYENTLPVGFNGTFFFTNWSDEDFVGKWGGKEYHFPKGTRCPILITDQTPLEVQSIRKKFAKDLAEREFGKGVEFKRLKSQETNPDGSARLNSIHQAGSYSLDHLVPYIQKCLEPLEIAEAEVTIAETVPLESKLSKDEHGELNTTAVDKKISLKDKARQG